MRKRNRVFFWLAGLGAASGMALSSCNDYMSFQDGEPDGPIKVVKLTLFDNDGSAGPKSRDVAVFTDTSIPADCGYFDPATGKQMRPDNPPGAKDTPTCKND